MIHTYKHTYVASSIIVRLLLSPNGGLFLVGNATLIVNIVQFIVASILHYCSLHWNSGLVPFRVLKLMIEYVPTILAYDIMAIHVSLVLLIVVSRLTHSTLVSVLHRPPVGSLKPTATPGNLSDRKLKYIKLTSVKLSGRKSVKSVKSGS